MAPSRRTTTFRNDYDDHRRSQIVLERASPIRARELAPAIGHARIIHLGPVAREAGIFDAVLPNLTLSGLHIIHKLNL